MQFSALPLWAKWVAQDWTGAWWAFETKPRIVSSNRGPVYLNDGNNLEIARLIGSSDLLPEHQRCIELATLRKEDDES